MTEKRAKGNAGESLVCEYLKDKGYIIAARNYTTRLGEIDIIAENRSLLAFVEVKTRTENGFILPREAVDKHKQRKIAAAAGEYVQKTCNSLPVRFDVAEVVISGNEKADMKINYIENAFLPEDMFWN